MSFLASASRPLASAVRAVAAPPCPPPACAAVFLRSFAVSSSAPAARSAPPSSSSGGRIPSASGSAGGRIPTEVFRSKLPSAETHVSDLHRLQRKNALLGGLLFLGVASIWGYSVWVTEDVKDKFTTPEVQQIEAELEKEDREEQARAEKNKQ